MKIDEFKQALIKQGIEVIDDHVRPDVIRFYVSIRSEIELNLWKIKLGGNPPSFNLSKQS